MTKLILFIFLISFAGVYSADIRVITTEYPPLAYEEKEGKISGFCMEVIEEAFKIEKLENKIEIMPWARAYNIAKTREDVMVFPITRSKLRENNFKWAGPLIKYNFCVYRNKKDKNIIVNSLEDLKKYKIQVMRNSVGKEFLISNGFKLGENIEEVVETTSTVLKFLNGDIQIICDYTPLIKFTAEKNGKNLDEIEKIYEIEELNLGMYAAFSKNIPDETVEKINNGIEKIKKNGKYEEIYKKWFK